MGDVKKTFKELPENILKAGQRVIPLEIMIILVDLLELRHPLISKCDFSLKFFLRKSTKTSKNR